MIWTISSHVRCFILYHFYTSGSRWQAFVPSIRFLITIFSILFISLTGYAQQPAEKNSEPVTLKAAVPQPPGNTMVMGKIVDGLTNQPLPFVNVGFSGSRYGTSTNQEGEFLISAPGSFNRVTFSFLGYKTVIREIKPGQVNKLTIKLSSSQKELNQVLVVSAKKVRYRNKDNPAVELIQQVIDHKDSNRMENTGYLQYDDYERIGLSLVNIPPKLMNNRFLSKYQFMLDTALTVDGKKQLSAPVYFNEKISQTYFRKNPEKNIHLLQAEKGINIIKFIDTAGIDIYLNRLYGNNIDIYENNLFVITNQFLSPIADHAPNFYKFFITDTVQTQGGKLIELSFTPRSKGDLLFDGKLFVTLDGRYAVASCELNVSKQVNINFLRTLKINLDFKQQPGGRYYLVKSNVKADFGLLRNKGMGMLGERTTVYSNYKLNLAMPASFYEGKEEQTVTDFTKHDTSYWALHRTDSLTGQQSAAYLRVNRLQNMQSFKTLTWVAATLTGDYANLGPVQFGPVGSVYSYNTQEGSRFQLAGRTTPEFNRSIYLDGYTGYGIRDRQLKYELSTYFSLNKTPPYRFPNNYFKVSYLYDVDIPGQSSAANNSQAALSSFQSGSTNYWLYDRIFSLAYYKDFENHFSYNIGFRNWNQQAAGTLRFQLNDQNSTFIHDLTTSELTLRLRYAPHEQIIQGTQERRTIRSKYPIFNLQITKGIKGFVNGAYNYTGFTANVYKRFYLSQLGYSDVTLLGSVIIGKVPFPLLNISPANQSFAYDADAYNKMYYLEFVSDHYAGINFTQSFNGFFLNKLPLVKKLKWREYLSGKVLYGGLRNENNPLYSKDLYQFPAATNNAKGTYGLGSTPYLEAGAGIGNIFKAIRLDLIKRFNYLNHPGVSPYSIKLSISPDF